MDKKRPRIALVNQRYGEEVNGGSEYYTKQLAEHLNMLYDVEVLTTKALDYSEWENYYTADTESINGVPVRRFDVAKKRNVPGMKIWKRVRSFRPLQSWAENRWIDAQGPYTPDLLRYLDEHGGEYAAIIFVTYLYYPTARGLLRRPERAILLPTAHDEPYIDFGVYRQMFSAAQGMIYLTPEEKAFVESKFPVADKPNCIAGAGIDLPQTIDNKAFREKYAINEDYLIYVGRIDPDKGCSVMFRAFRQYKDAHPDSSLKLLLLGRPMMEIPAAEDIVPLGFVSEEDKFNALAGARALWLPSQYESLSIAVLEALSLGVPVLVNGACEVLRGHCVRSEAGFWYQSEEEAAQMIDALLGNIERGKISEKAKQYVSENYQWDAIMRRVCELIDQLKITV